MQLNIGRLSDVVMPHVFKKSSYMFHRYFPYFSLFLFTTCQGGAPSEPPPAVPHKEDWAVFLRETEAGPLVVTVDLGWANPAPLDNFNKLLALSVKTQESLPNGFPSEEEVEMANQLQDQLIRALEKAGQGIFVGSQTSFGQKSFFFYLPDNREAERISGQVLAGFKSRPVEQDIRKDPEWAAYFDRLYPNPQERGEIQNERVLQQLQGAGDRLLQPRPIDHWAHFSTTAQRDSFLRQAQAEGFEFVEMNVLEDEADEPYMLHIIRMDSIHIPYIHELTWYLTQLAEKYNGSYDGWETVVARE